MPLEKSREEKEAYAQLRMAEMKLKNEKLKERHMEVQRDREKAEERNSSITTGRSVKREAERDLTPKAKQEREWDRGKPNPDSADWDSSKHRDYCSKNTRVSGYSNRRIRKDDSWRSRSANASNKPTSSFFSKFHSNKNEAIPESSIYRNDTSHFNSRSRSQFHSSNPVKSHTTNESSLHSYPNSKLDDQAKIFSEVKYPSPPKYSESKREPARRAVNDGMDELMWQCGSMNEAQHKMSRIENWVKSININHGFTDTTEALNSKDDFQHNGKIKDLCSHRERSKKYGLGEDSGTKKTKENFHFRMKEKPEHKFNQSVSNLRGRGNRSFAGDRYFSITDSKTQRDGKRKILNERSRRNCELDMSDRASSMKESDDLDWGRDKIIRARSNSKSSDNSYKSGIEKEVISSEEPNVEPSGCHCNENLESNELIRLNTWNDEKHKETSNKQSRNFRKKFQQGNDKHKFGSKSLPSYDSLENYKNKGHNYQRSNRKKPNIQVKNKKCMNKSKFGWGSKSESLDGGKESFDYNSQKFSLNSHQNGENLNKTVINPRFSKRSSKMEAIPIQSIHTSNLSNAEDIEDEIQIVEEKCEQGFQIVSNFAHGTIKGKPKKNKSPRNAYISETTQNSDSDCQIIGDWNEVRDLKDCVTKSPAFNTVSKSTGTRFSGKLKADYLDLDSHSSEKSDEVISKDFDPDCQIIESTVRDNSFLESDINCGDVYKKNMESAEHIINALQCKQKDSLRSQKIKRKHYSYKHKFAKTGKPSQKSKLRTGGKKIPDKSLTVKMNSKNCANFEVLYLITDSEPSDYDSSLDVTYKNLGKHGVKPVFERKQILTGNAKLEDETGIGALNLSDDEWCTISDEDDSDQVEMNGLILEKFTQYEP